MTETSAYAPNLINTFVWLALLLPLLSSLISFLISERYAWVISILTPFLTLVSALSACYVFYLIKGNAPHLITVPWFTLGELSFSASILLNDLSALMLLLVSVISFLVHMYSTGYMAGDGSIKKYFAMLGFFTFSMQGIVLAENLLLIFVFWELVGFSSYMLIGHWMSKPEAAAAARKAFIFNRIGDLGFLIALMIIWANTNTFDISGLPLETLPWKTAASLCLFCGIAGKSAQFPLLTWLPDAMEGPTPVSALIHAATMVAAGVFLLARLFFLFSPEALDVVAIIGILTALMGALSALSQHDIKKILAYSTISQLGLMVTAVGAGAPYIAILHLFTHAFFKACLFLGAGSVIHALHQAQLQSHQTFDIQDIRNLGGLRKKLPLTFAAFVVCGSALAGIPLTSGFLSKDAILAAIWRWTDTGWHWIVAASALIISLLTVLYTFRLIWNLFMRKETLTQNMAITEPPVVMRAPIAVLTAGSLWFMISGNPVSFSGWFLEENVYHNMWLTLFSIIWITIALTLAFLMYRAKPVAALEVLLNGFYLDNVYKKLIGNPIQHLSTLSTSVDVKWIDGAIHNIAFVQVTMAHIAGWFDRIFVDGLVNGMAKSAKGIGAVTRSFQSGKIQHYVFWAVIGLIIFLFWTFN